MFDGGNSDEFCHLKSSRFNLNGLEEVGEEKEEDI